MHMIFECHSLLLSGKNTRICSLVKVKPCFNACGSLICFWWLCWSQKCLSTCLLLTDVNLCCLGFKVSRDV